MRFIRVNNFDYTLRGNHGKINIYISKTRPESDLKYKIINPYN